MSKIIGVFAAIIASLFFSYAVLSSLVNQGHDIRTAGILVVVIIIGVFLLVRAVRNE